ncbi:MAG: hypothetical protein AAF512_12405, partial [Pseudomonadota bacterium]
EKELLIKQSVAEQQLHELQKNKTSLFEAFDHFMAALLSPRGVNILFSVFIFFATFFSLFYLRRLLFRMIPLQKIRNFNAIASLLDVTLYALTFVVAILALMVALYSFGEILALVIVCLILLGLVWTMREALPKFFEQIKLLIGYGPVRQHELTYYKGLPFIVDSIGMYSFMHNSELSTGQTIRLPISDLVKMRSRPIEIDENGEYKEKMFPCSQGDYVLINGLKFRRVVFITQDTVDLQWLGMVETMPTAQFLQQSIQNMSATPTWIGIDFHIAYEHRFEIVSDIFEKLSEYVKEEFKKLPRGEFLNDIWVDVSGLNERSISLMLWGQFKPEGVGARFTILLDFNRIALQAANKFNWQILQFQATVRYAPGEESTAMMPQETAASEFEFPQAKA